MRDTRRELNPHISATVAGRRQTRLYSSSSHNAMFIFIVWLLSYSLAKRVTMHSVWEALSGHQHFFN